MLTIYLTSRITFYLLYDYTHFTYFILLKH